MLENINNIDWKNLTHAYGSAEDVPSLIINLASEDKSIRDSALYYLYGNIFHQGTRYEATPYSIPFLYELIDNESVQDRDKIITLLINLALGYEEIYLPQGLDIERFKTDLLEEETRFTDEQKSNYLKYGYSTQALLNCYEYVKAGVPALIHCLQNQEVKIRIAAIYALSWFPETAQISIPKIIENLSNENDELEIAHLLLALGLLARQSAKPEFIFPIISPYLQSSSDLIKICAAISLARNPIETEILAILIDGVKAAPKWNYVEGLLYNEGALSGYISRTLSEYGKSEREKIIPALCQALKTLSVYQALDITYAILSIINSQRTKPLKDEDLENFTALEKEVLNTLYEFDMGGFVNYSNLLRNAGVPDSKEKLGELLKKK